LLLALVDDATEIVMSTLPLVLSRHAFGAKPRMGHTLDAVQSHNRTYLVSYGGGEVLRADDAWFVAEWEVSEENPIPTTVTFRPVRLVVPAKRPAVMFHSMVSFSAERIVVFGGLSSTASLSSSICNLNLMRGAVDTIVNDNDQTRWPSARAGHTACKLDDARMVVFGGYTAGDVLLNDIWLWNINLQVWTPLQPSDPTAPVPMPRCFHASVVSGCRRYMLIYGGFHSDYIALFDSWLFDFHRREWLLLTNGLPARFGHTMHIAADKTLVVIGGWHISDKLEPNVTSDVFAFEVLSKTQPRFWAAPQSNIPSPAVEEPLGAMSTLDILAANFRRMPYPFVERAHHASVVFPQVGVFVMGGRDGHSRSRNQSRAQKVHRDCILLPVFGDPSGKWPRDAIFTTSEFTMVKKKSAFVPVSDTPPKAKSAAVAQKQASSVVSEPRKMPSKADTESSNANAKPDASAPPGPSPKAKTHGRIIRMSGPAILHISQISATLIRCEVTDVGVTMLKPDTMSIVLMREEHNPDRIPVTTTLLQRRVFSFQGIDPESLCTLRVSEGTQPIFTCTIEMGCPAPPEAPNRIKVEMISQDSSTTGDKSRVVRVAWKMPYESGGSPITEFRFYARAAAKDILLETVRVPEFASADAVFQVSHSISSLLKHAVVHDEHILTVALSSVNALGESTAKKIIDVPVGDQP
jgi:hypothetical protein